ncbi:dihydroneopterin aldolase [soil metagenome]
MTTIVLSELRFYSYHGVHQEERITGTDFIVSAQVRFDENSQLIKELHQTINYVTVFEIIRKRMEVSTMLLETIAMETANDIYNLFPFVNYIKVSIAKQHPPVESLKGDVGVCWEKEF